MPFISKEELDAMADKVAQELGLGSEEFLRGHEELMQMINETERKQQETRQSRQMMDCKDVIAALGVSESVAYKIIRKLNGELQKAGYITVRGKISRAYFTERTYGVNTNA